MDWHLDNLRALYRGENLANCSPLIIEMDAYFIASWHMQDWLLNDSAISEIGKVELDAMYQASEPLRLCNAYANTVKHFELRDPARLRSRIAQFQQASDGSVRILLEFSSSVDAPIERDALELAEAVNADWRSFFREYDLAG